MLIHLFYPWHLPNKHPHQTCFYFSTNSLNSIKKAEPKELPKWIENQTFEYKLTLKIKQGDSRNILCSNRLLGIRQKVGLLWAQHECWVFESWHGNSSSFALHKLHFHCDSRACPAWQPIASLTINLISEKAVHLFGSKGIEILMKWLLLKSRLWTIPQPIFVLVLFLQL